MTTLYKRRLQGIAIFVFKIKHGMLPSSVTELFNTSHTNYNLRNADFRQKCFNTTKYGKHSLRHFGPLLWSKINRELRSAPTLSNFKKGIRKTDIASLIDDSCNHCVLCKSQHQFASPFYSFLELLNLRFRDIIRQLFIRTRIQSLNQNQNLQYITRVLYI